MRRRTAKSISFIIALGLWTLSCSGPQRASAAVGCALANPIRDLKYLFPEMTRYKEELRDFSTMADGRALYRALNQRLGSDLDQLYEGFGTPYTIYTVFTGNEIIGYAHGVNVPGEYGLIQIVLSMDPGLGTIRRIYYQRLEGPAARALRQKEFLDQFAGLSLADFYMHIYLQIAEPGSPKDRVARIRNPVAEGRGKNDFDATIRGVRKNLILLDFFIYDRKFEPIYQQVRAKLAKSKS